MATLKWNEANSVSYIGAETSPAQLVLNTTLSQEKLQDTYDGTSYTTDKNQGLQKRAFNDKLAR